MRSDTMEEKSMELARHFFSGISDGDIEAIKQRLFTMHELYKGQ